MKRETLFTMRIHVILSATTSCSASIWVWGERGGGEERETLRHECACYSQRDFIFLCRYTCMYVCVQVMGNTREREREKERERERERQQKEGTKKLLARQRARVSVCVCVALPSTFRYIARTHACIYNYEVSRVHMHIHTAARTHAQHARTHATLARIHTPSLSHKHKSSDGWV